MKNYRVLSTSTHEYNGLKLVPVRHDDRFEIMNWRNQQIKYLRQTNPLTKYDQDKYFSETVASLFDQDNPELLLFSYLENEELIGYGGLVHINWRDRHAEISFLLCSSKNDKASYLSLFLIYLSLIEKVAIDINLNKIFTVGYNIQSYRFLPLIEKEYNLDATLKNHLTIDGKARSVLIYSKLL